MSLKNIHVLTIVTKTYAKYRGNIKAHTQSLITLIETR